MSSYVTKEALVDFLKKLDTAFGKSGALYLIGETTHVFEGWRDWTTQIELCAEVADEDRAAFDAAVSAARAATGHDVLNESPGDYIPLPAGFEERARDGSNIGTQMKVRHFDPYSVAYRFIARGSEPDYHIALMYIDKGWITWNEMDERLDALLPEFSMETIAQDPAEFRRRYKGLLQLYHAVKPRQTHRRTSV